MPQTYFISDTHFGHLGVCKFTREDGSKLRPWTDPDVMNQDMKELWNDIVGPKDLVYHLGDVVINRRYLPFLSELNGRKKLIRGNHDIFHTKDYIKYFEEIEGVHVFDDFICSHIPLREESITKRFATNVHGHLHAYDIPDPRYFCVCVEQIGYKPISIDELRKAIKQKKEQYDNQ